MKRLGLVVLCIAILVLFLARGDEERPDPAPESEVARRPAPIPIPGPPAVDPAEEAHGIYILEGDGAEIALELQQGRAFRSSAKFPDREVRVTKGTWSLAGADLTLTYRYLGSEPIPGGPKLERCKYRGETIEIKLPGRDSPVVLRKVTFIRNR